MIPIDDQHRLLRLARAALEARVRGLPAPPIDRGGMLDVLSGAFVTIHHRGELRGCLGRIEAAMRLADVVVHLAGIVADSDPRFPPVLGHELADIALEISVLTPEREVTDVEHIQVGRHGLIIEQGHCRGLLLPQVAIEQRWDRITFLEQTCVKAGVAPDAWRLGARILCFEAHVFGEREFEHL